MKFRTTHSPLLLLLLPSLASALSPAAAVVAAQKEEAAGAALAAAGPKSDVDSAGVPIPIQGRHDLPTKDAPVDGKDGKPHSGPFVGSDDAIDKPHEKLPPLKGRPRDPTVVDGKKIPESNDGVMFDKNRDKPQEGTTGTEGGVSEKDKARKVKEDKTGEKAKTQPEPPKEHPPLPHSEEQKIHGTDKEIVDKGESSKNTDNDEGSTEYTGLGVRTITIP